MVPIIEASGIIAFNSPHFSTVAREASRGYLDRIFVDMMWYKTISLYIMLDIGYNVLFQDLDIVWFKDPFYYMHQLLTSTAPGITNTFSHI